MASDMSLTSTKCLQKGFNTQHCLLLMIEKWCKSLYVGGHATAVLTDLSKIFDCMIHSCLRCLGVSNFLLFLSYLLRPKQSCPIVNLKKLFPVHPKDPFWVLLLLIYAYANLFLKRRIWVLLAI